MKAGTFLENVEVSRKKTNLMLVGDGIGKTVVKASRNVVDGWTTFQSATFGAFDFELSSSFYCYCFCLALLGFSLIFILSKKKKNYTYKLIGSK